MKYRLRIDTICEYCSLIADSFGWPVVKAAFRQFEPKMDRHLKMMCPSVLRAPGMTSITKSMGMAGVVAQPVKTSGKSTMTIVPERQLGVWMTQRMRHSYHNWSLSE